VDDGRTGLADLLGRVVPGGDAVSFAEALWLAAVMPTGARIESSSPGADDRHDDEAESEAPGERSAQQPANLYDAAPARAPGITVTQVAIDAGRALPHALDIARSLRPLKRRLAAGRGLELDLDATVEAYARTRRLIPAMSAARERWFDAVVVVDTSPAMALWQDTVGEFVRLLNHTGVFRTVHRWDLSFCADGISMRNPAGRQATPREAVSSDGRRLIIIFSDCAAEAWREPEIWSIARLWAASGPAVLVTPLPPRLWRRTGMNRPAARVHARTPGCAGSGLSHPQIGPAGEQPATGAIPIPAVSLDPASLATWANALMCTSSGGCEAILVPRAPTPGASGRSAAEHQPPIAKRVSGFLATASDNAVKLATLCSPFSRISFPLLLLLGRSIDRAVAATDIAEVVLSGLFTLDPQDDGSTSFRLHGEAKAALAGRLSKRDALRSFNSLTRSIEEGRGPRRDFLVAAQSARGTQTVPLTTEPFAVASQELQAILGGASGTRKRPQPSAPSEPGSYRAGSVSPSTRAEVDAFGPSFFLSYARVPPLRGDRSDPHYWVRRLFHELTEEIRSLDGGLRRGFMPDHVPPGATPEAMADRNLASCRIFVPLYGDDYFYDEQCGREWAVFERRRQLRRARTGDGGGSIVPVLWTRQRREDWPPVAHRMQPQPLLSNDLYQRLGLLELMKLHERAYREAVRQLAEEIVRRARTEVPPTPSQDALSFAQPAFPMPGRSTRQVIITVAADTRRDIPNDRNPEYYGDRPEDWRPYHPESGEPIVERAARIARSLGYRPEITVLTSTSPETKMNSQQKPLDAQLPQPPAASILLADPWLFRAYRQRRNLERVDRHRKEWVRLMVPWCATDQETAENRDSLESHVRDTAPWMVQSWRRTCPQGLMDLATVEEFDLALPTMIDRARHHFLSESRPTLFPTLSDGYSGRPRLAPPPEDEPPRARP
jgi:FxsC-like protein